MGFISGWDYKHYNEYISQKIVNLSTTNKIHLKCDVIDGSVVNGLRQPFFNSFAIFKPLGYKNFSEPETIQYKKTNKSVLNTITFYLENDNKGEVNFNAETMTFTLQMIKIMNELINELPKFKSESYSVGGRPRSNTVKIYGGITSKVSKTLIGYGSYCNRKKSMTFSDNTIKAEGLGSFFKNLGKTSAKAAKKLATKALKNPVDSLNSVLMQLQQPQAEILKQLYQHYLNTT